MGFLQRSSNSSTHPNGDARKANRTPVAASATTPSTRWKRRISHRESARRHRLPNNALGRETQAGSSDPFPAGKSIGLGADQRFETACSRICTVGWPVPLQPDSARNAAAAADVATAWQAPKNTFRLDLDPQRSRSPWGAGWTVNSHSSTTLIQQQPLFPFTLCWGLRGSLRANGGCCASTSRLDNPAGSR